jgi:hypothetical protein
MTHPESNSDDEGGLTEGDSGMADPSEDDASAADERGLG